MDTPVLLVIFNRPDTTAKVMSEIANAQPKQLFVAADGPRVTHPSDQELTTRARQVVEESVTWDCDIQTLYRSENLGIRRGEVSAFDWFFSHVTEGIILEDDCVPHPDFFAFCEELLDKYRDDHRIWAIQGDNSGKARITGSASYGFIPHALGWGWATWRRSWQQYDRDLELWKAIRGTKAEKKIWPDRIERKLQTKNLESLLENPDITWDYQWGFTVRYHNGLTIIPRSNLISNVGWGRRDATNTKGKSLRQSAPTHSILPLQHPKRIQVDRRAASDILNGRVFGAGKNRMRFKFAKHVRRLARRISMSAPQK